jgi:uncharacterized membrane protein HdeD (DUF308 family)
MKKIIITSAVLSPAIAFAAAFSGIKDIIVGVGDLVKTSIPIAYALAILFFFWGIAKFVYKAGDTKAKEEGKNIMIWGVIAIFVIASWQGLIGFIQKNLGIEKGGSGSSDISIGNV